MLLDAKSCESSDQAAYRQACTTKVQIELESLCYHSCHFVRSRAVSRVQRYRLPANITEDVAPTILVTILLRRDLQGSDINRIGLHLQKFYDRLPKDNKQAYKRYRAPSREALRILNAQINELTAPKK